MDQATKKEFEKLARITQAGFSESRGEINERFEQVDKRFVEVDYRLDNIRARLNVIEKDIAEIRRHFVYRDEFEDALSRIALLEKKLGVKSGK